MCIRDRELTVTADSLAQNTYPGYKFSSYAPADIKAGSVVADKQIIRVNYEKDEDAKVEVKYTVPVSYTHLYLACGRSPG